MLSGSRLERDHKAPLRGHSSGGGTVRTIICVYIPRTLSLELTRVSAIIFKLFWATEDAVEENHCLYVRRSGHFLSTPSLMAPSSLVLKTPGLLFRIFTLHPSSSYTIAQLHRGTVQKRSCEIGNVWGESVYVEQHCT